MLPRLSGLGDGLRGPRRMARAVCLARGDGSRSMCEQGVSGEVEAMRPAQREMTTSWPPQRELVVPLRLRLGQLSTERQSNEAHMPVRLSVSLARPGEKFRATRSSGFVESNLLLMVSTLRHCKDQNVYMQIPIAGSIEVLVDEPLRGIKYQRPLAGCRPAAAKAYAALTNEVIDCQGPGSGVIRGVGLRSSRLP